MTDNIRKAVHRPTPTATWRISYRWGTMIGDTTDLVVSRDDGGKLRIYYGEESVVIRKELVSALAEMVTEAAEWTDSND